MSARPALSKVQIIQRSMRCFAWGLTGALPVIGLPFAVAALFTFGGVSLRKGAQWNPAERYLVWGVTAATAGLLLTVLVALILVIELT